MGWLEKAGLSKDFVAKHIFVPGGAFRWPQKLRGDITKNRYFFILNISPDSGDLIILVSPTTELEKTYRFNYPGDIVKISKKDYDSLECECVVNCSDPLKYNREKILQAITKQEVELLPPIPNALLKTLRDTLVQSTKVSDDIKNLVCEEENGCDTINTSTD